MNEVISIRKHLLPSEEFADMVGVKRNTPATWRCKKFGPPHIKIGSRVFYDYDDVVAWLNTRRRKWTGETLPIN